MRADTYLCNEKGSMSIVTLCTLALVIAGSIYMFYFFAVYIEKRQAQNIADAASLAAVQVLRDKFEEAMKKKTGETVEQFLAELSSEYEAIDPEEGRPPFEEFKKSYINDHLQSDELKRKLIADSYDNDDDWPLVVKEKHFADLFTARKNGDMLYDAYNQNAGLIQAAAQDAIELNHGKPSGKITFPDEKKPKLLLEASRTIRIDAIGLEKEIVTVAAAGVGSKHFDLDGSGKTPRDIRW